MAAVVFLQCWLLVIPVSRVSVKSPAVCGSLHGRHPSQEEQAMGLCRAGFQAAAQVRSGHISSGVKGPLCHSHHLHETPCCHLMSLIIMASLKLVELM